MADKLYYALHTSDAAHGLPARHIIYGFSTRKDRDDYINRVARERESFAKIMREQGYCGLAIATTWDHAETLPATLVNHMVDAARAKYPDKAEYIAFGDTGNPAYSSNARVAAFLY